MEVGGRGEIEASGRPPGGDGRRRKRGRRGEGEEEVCDAGALGRGETAVPDEVEGEIASEEMAVVVLQGWSGSGDEGGGAEGEEK